MKIKEKNQKQVVSMKKKIVISFISSDDDAPFDKHRVCGRPNKKRLLTNPFAVNNSIIQEQKKKVQAQELIYQECLNWINELKNKIHQCFMNYKNTYKCSFKHFKSNKHLYTYRDDLMNKNSLL